MQDKAKAALQNPFDGQSEREQQRQPTRSEWTTAVLQPQQQADGVDIDCQRCRAERVDPQPLTEQTQQRGQCQQADAVQALVAIHPLQRAGRAPQQQTTGQRRHPQTLGIVSRIKPGLYQPQQRVSGQQDQPDNQGRGTKQAG